LLDNRPDWLHPTGQKIKYADPDDAFVLRAISCDGLLLNVTWEDGSNGIHTDVSYPIEFLVRWAGPTGTWQHRRPIPEAYDAKSWASIVGHEYTEVMSSNEGLLAFLEDLHDYGATIINGAPIDTQVVSNISSRMSFGGAMNTLYGEQWTVKSQVQDGPKNNIAYTSSEIGLHQDLAYYESMPGFQLLHCISRGEGVVGGENLLIDVFKIAETFRKDDWAAFRSLQEIPATFVKFDMDRKRAAHFEYQTPHIHVHPETGDVLKVVWSPPFEGPLRAPLGRVEEFFRSRKAFVKTIAKLSKTHLLEYTLKRGQVVVFNNVRMLHGRRAFQEKSGGGRILEGAYVNIDEFRNRLEVVRRLVTGSARSTYESVHLGNRCF
jgi:gamma-butyrobetaine dioxygenase